RRRALQGDRLRNEILDSLEEYIGDLVDKYFEDVQAEALKEDVRHNLLTEIKIEPEEFEKLGKEGIIKLILENAKDFYAKKEEMLGSETMAQLERGVTLSIIDHKWKEHLREMDDLKEGIGLRAYGQKDPLIEYKGEAFKLFITLLNEIRDEIVSGVFRFFPQGNEEIQRRRRQPQGRIVESKSDATNAGLRGSSQGQPEGQQVGKLQPVQAEEKIGRNEPCPCGSGKKYKNCHGK
ncbi:MAG: SEC-C metal-binding domain-containing protein, partial [Bacteroidota bacterium]|nr:SEC-C metal-binding domain-containing protein [Bacteroidota bacterium]